ncbi:hypothetical protein [uncultured Amaricoccus sp.]|uniref:DUF7697 family protein n=1 Tax=uncultured Amaricoccus sp. TaxID=339341 RepID=UPI00262B10CC|nr:hypothetical protein [uncultured Amaricoccus sp.]
MNRPETIEGTQVWDLALRMGGQVRAIPGALLGWDMSAGLALGAALGITPIAVAELLPDIEAIAVRKINELTEAGRDG